MRPGVLDPGRIGALERDLGALDGEAVAQDGAGALPVCTHVERCEDETNGEESEEESESQLSRRRLPRRSARKRKYYEESDNESEDDDVDIELDAVF